MIRTASAALLLLGACTTASASGAPTGRDCFVSSSVLGYSVIDEHNVSVHVGAHRDYILSTTWNASGLNWRDTIALHSATGWICTGNGLGVEVSGGDPRQTYPISSIIRAPEAQGS